MNKRAALLTGFASALLITALAGASAEIREFMGVKLSAFNRKYDNSIKGPKQVDPKAYRLTVDGLVKKPLSLTYSEILANPFQDRVVLMPCVEGWQERLLYRGVPIKDILAKAEPLAGAKSVFFHCADGYSTALPLKYLLGQKALLGYRINGLALDAKRGFPFQLVVEGKLGYKWAKWIVRMELTQKPRPGYWEKRGYSDRADYP